MISAENVSYHYTQTTQQNGIDEINLRIGKGELWVIAGKSGCGKTTLSKCINGLIPHFEEGSFEGDVNLVGQNTRNMEVGRIGELVGSVFQDPRSQFFTTTVFDELSFGCRNMGLSANEIYRRMDEATEILGLEKLRDRMLLHLSSGEKQKIAIASCYCMSPQVFLLDEPSANLDAQAIEDLQVMLKQLKKMGHTIIVLEHRMYYLRELLDYFAFMEDGKIQTVYTKQEALRLSNEELRERGLRLFYPELAVTCRETTKKGSKVNLEIRQLTFQYENAEKPTFYNVDMKMREGEIIALTGCNGVGKTTLAQVLTGLLKEQSGSICWKGFPMTPKQRLRKVYYVLQDSDYQLFAESVEKELLLGLQENQYTQIQMEGLLEYFDLQVHRCKHPMALSRGQKQRVTIAAALMSDAEVIILDEPSSGLDGENMRRLGNLLQEIANAGKTILIISHDEEFIRAYCDRVVELREDMIYEKEF